MKKTALDLIISKLADTSVAPAMDAPEAVPQTPTIDIVKYLVTFLTKKAKGNAIKYDASLKDYTSDSIAKLTYGEGDNFQWDSFLCFFTTGGKRGVYICGLTSDGRQGKTANVFGDTPYTGKAAAFTAELKTQGVPFPFLEPGAALKYQELGLGDANFIDISNENGEKDDGRADSFEGSRAMNHFDKTDPGTLKLPAFKSKYGGEDSYRFVDLRNKMLHKIDGTEDRASTEAIKQALANKPAVTAPEAASAFKPQGVGDTRFASEASMDVQAQETGSPVQKKDVEDATDAVEELNDSLQKTNEIISGGKSASMRKSVAAVLLKASEI